MTVAEIVSELMYAGKSLEEIASYDPAQLLWVISRKRDRCGKLIRNRELLPPGVHVDENGMRIVKNPTPFNVMFKQVKTRQGLTREEVAAEWAEYRANNPKLGVGGV